MKTLIAGASPNPDRYAYLCAVRLLRYGHEIILFGKHKGEIEGHTISNDKTPFKDVDTVTLYLNPMHQQPLYDYILSLKPKRIIFNPGAENPEFENHIDLISSQFIDKVGVMPEGNLTEINFIDEKELLFDYKDF